MDEGLLRFINSIKVAKARYPSMRLGQLIVNATCKNTPLFYMEDDELCHLLFTYEVEKGKE